MVFEKILAKKPDKIRRESEKKPTRELGYAPWYFKAGVSVKAIVAELDPFKTVLIIIFIGFLAFGVIGFLLPFFEVIGELPNKMPILGGLSLFSLAWFLCDRLNRSIRDNICEVSVEDGNILVDNRKIDVYEGGEVIYHVNFYGRPIICKDEANMRRYGKQECTFVPKQVINQFGSILGRRAKAYPDCKFQTTYMKDIDQGILYIPRKISESRLLKKLEVAEQNLGISNEIIEKLKSSILSIVKDLGGHESEQLKELIKRTTSLQEAFMATPERIKRMVDEQYWRTYRGKYDRRHQHPYSKFGEQGKPPWEEITSVNPEKPLMKEDEG